MQSFDICAKRRVKPIWIHKARTCGIEWNPDGRFLASGGGDGSVVCWDVRAGKPLEIDSLTPSSESDPSSKDTANLTATGSSSPIFSTCWCTRKHLSMVKVLAWCPWAPDLLASGGGTCNGIIRFWDAVRGMQCPLRLSTRAQVLSLHFSPACCKIVSTHGFVFALGPGRRRSRNVVGSAVPAGLVRNSMPGTSSADAMDIDVDVDGVAVLPSPHQHSILVHSYPCGEVVGKIFDEMHGCIMHSSLSPDGTRLMMCSSDNSVRVYQVFGKQEVLVPDEDMCLQNIVC